MSTEQNNGKPAVPPKRNLLNNRRIHSALTRRNPCNQQNGHVANHNSYIVQV